MSKCAGYEAGSKYPCRRLDAVEVVAGCLHEHVGPRDLCPNHIDDVQRGWMVCGECLQAGCDCRLQILTLTARKP